MAPSCLRSTLRAARFTGAGLVVAGCMDASRSVGLGGFLPVNEVVVYAGSSRLLVEVGDTLRVNAEGFNNGNGAGVERPSGVSFNVSDPGTVGLESTAWTLPIVPTIRARGLRPGVVTITARINGVSGSDSLRVIPVVQVVTLSPNPATVVVGDSVQLTVLVVGTNGDAITTVRPFVTIDTPSGIVLHAGWNLFKGNALGTATVQVSVGRKTGVGTITVVPRPL